MTFRMVKRTSPVLMVMAVLSLGGMTANEAEAGQAPAAPRSPREAAPFDVTGYWTAVVSEDWRWRMVTPAKGDFASVPLNPEGTRVANEWDPAKDAAAGAQCKPFGAAGIMRMPTRLRIGWENDTTLKVETDHGQQTRLLQFPSASGPGVVAGQAPGAPAALATLAPLAPGPATGPRSLQGNTVARWNVSTLEAATGNLSEQYLRRNGIPVSEDAVVLEYWNRHSDFGDEWLTITTVVRDPKFLRQDFITSSSFKKLPDGSKWTPLPCDRA